jgi:hypothetical protein
VGSHKVEQSLTRILDDTLVFLKALLINSGSETRHQGQGNQAENDQYDANLDQSKAAPT